MADANSTRDAVKRNLNITWSDDTTDARIADIIAAMGPFVATRIGLASSTAPEALDAEDFGLFANACFYEWNHVRDDFTTNYADDIIAARIKHETAWQEAQDAQAQ